jgi:3-phenylpropionate/cinnamic acid dioxygenase small subunit
MTEQEAIRQTLARYAQRNDARDVEGWCAVFTEDARFTTQQGEFVGQAALRAFIEGLYASRPTRRTRHINGAPAIVVDGDVATADSDVIFYERIDDGPWRLAGANHYRDRLVRRNGDWLLQERHLTFT